MSRHQPRTAISIITAAQNTAVAKFGTAIINFDLRIYLSVPVKAPFVNVTMHVIQSPRIGQIRTYSRALREPALPIVEIADPPSDSTQVRIA